MPDREKVIAELQEYHDREWTDERMDGYRERKIRKRATGNALALLKEQDAVEPIPPEDEFGLYRCGKCHHQLFRCVDKYCSRCGQAVKWE